MSSSKKIQVILPNENFNGKPYSTYIAEYMNKVLGSHPDVLSARENPIPIRIGGGGGGYSNGSATGPVNPPISLQSEELIFRKTGLQAIQMEDDQALLLSPMLAFNMVDVPFFGKEMKELDQVRGATIEEMEFSKVGLNIYDNEKKPPKYIPVLDSVGLNLKNFKMTSESFDLTVSPYSELRKRLDVELPPGEYRGVVVSGIFVLLKFPEGKYLVQVFGIGNNNYSHHEVVEVNVRPAVNTIEDISASLRNPGFAIAPNNLIVNEKK